MKDKLSDKRLKFSIGYVLVWVLILILVQQFIVKPLLLQSTEIPYSEFMASLRAGEVSAVTVSEDQIIGTRLVDDQEQDFYTVRVEDAGLIEDLEAQAVEVTGQVASDGGLLGTLMGWILPLVLMFAFWYWIMGRMRGGSGGLGGSLFSMGKSKARLVQGEQVG
jgi:cell division protease FtsH